MKRILSFLLLWIAGCSVYADLSSYTGLDKRLREYYAHEQNKEWEKAYHFRTPAFRKTVMLPHYVSNMAKDSQGWKLKEFKIVGAQSIAGKVRVSMEFVEEGPFEIPKEFLPSDVKPNDLKSISQRIKGESIWIRIDNEWYVYDAVTRMHLSMNSPAVAE